MLFWWFNVVVYWTTGRAATWAPMGLLYVEIRSKYIRTWKHFTSILKVVFLSIFLQLKKRSTVKNCMVGSLSWYSRDILFGFPVGVERGCTQKRCTYGERLSSYFFKSQCQFNVWLYLRIPSVNFCALTSIWKCYLLTFVSKCYLTYF